MVYLRNAGEREVAVVFDGALLDVPWDNRIDLGIMPAGIVDGIEVAKGVPSVRFGANAGGGVIELRRDAERPPGSAIRLSAQTGAMGHPSTGGEQVIARELVPISFLPQLAGPAR